MSVDHPMPPYPSQKQPMPGSTAKMDPRPRAAVMGFEDWKSSSVVSGLLNELGIPSLPWHG